MSVSHKHEEKVDVLNTVAILAGYSESFGGRLPDGARPDVLRFQPETGALFIGDAKETERPFDQAVRARLSRYMQWFRWNIAARGTGGIFALCVGRCHDLGDWSAVIEDLALQSEIDYHRIHERTLSHDIFALWLEVTRNAFRY